MVSISLAVFCSLICLNAVGGASKGGSHAIAENDKGLCDDPLPPYFGSVSCTHKKNYRFVCVAECKNGYEFSNRKTKMIHRCHKQSGKWTPEEHFPDCQPICEPPCDNGGKCIEDNHCVCTSDHRGDRCEFSTSLCDPAVGLRVTANWKCNDTSSETVCVLTCPQGTQYETQPADIYHCSLDGVWNPNYAPKCLPINIIEPPKSHGMFSLTTGQAANYIPSGICAAWGQLHYRTFDGGIFSFQGSCTYLLAKDCVDNTFSIHIKGNPSCAGKTSCKLSVIIIFGTNEYVLSDTQDGPSVEWKSESYLIPAAIDGLLFQMMSGYVTVSSSLGFRLKWNREDSVLLKVNDQFKNKTCGLCGRFDGNVLNDFEMSDGTITENVEMFVDSWTMDKLSDVCPQGVTVQHPCIDDKLDKSIANAAGEVCEAIFDTRFAVCHHLVEPKPYFEACKMDYCACSSSSGTECICSTLAEYFRECVRLGGKIEGGWRSPDLCALSCPEGMIYEDCGTSCPKTCKSTVYNCEDSHCVDGCHCPSGTVLHNGNCVLQEACPCIHNGKEYQPGHKMALDCNGCECIGGKWECTKQKCEAQCSSVADPHYTTFDGLKYEFLGECSYYLVYHENFTIVQENALCNSLAENPSFSPEASCTKSVKINYQGNMLILNPHMQVIFNDNEINSLPLTENGITAYKASSQFLKVDLPNDVSLKWDGKNRIYVDAPPSLFGQTRGLCGTFNHNQKDDFLTSDDDIEADVKLFAERWKVEDSCHKRSRRSGISACELNPQKSVEAEKLCSVLKSEIFAACHDEVDPDSAYRGCVYDTCACGQNVRDCLCPALSDYSAQCTRKGIMIKWTEKVPACRQNCEGGQIYQECGNPCTSSCLVITSSALCKQTCVQGCSCPDGKTLNSDGFCIPIDECPCVYESKEYSPKSLITQGANICQCVNAQWNCNPADLKELIKLNPDFMIQDQPSSCSSENHEEETLCIEECPLTCQNMHLPSGCKTKICKRGCRCQNGYLLDTDLKKCVKLSECGCRHGGRKYAEGSAIRKDCNTCVCQKGTWQCSADICPGMCTVWGNSHFKTYDDRIYDFRGECEYILSKGKIDEEKYFSVSIQNVPCGTSGATCSKSFSLSVGKNEKITLTKGTPIPKTTYGSHFIVVESGLFVFIYTDIGISLQWDKSTRLYVMLDPKWRERVVGLCGNFNDDQSDDFQTPSGGLPEARAVIFADSWKTNDMCKKPNLTTDAYVHPDRETLANKKCSVLKSDVFAPCHSEVALDPYYERCISDSCTCDSGGDCDSLCTAIATYAHECNIHGVHIKWRSQDMCPIQCEECATYDACMSPCPKTTCETQYLYSGLAEKCTVIPCVEGCDPKPCPDGEMYNNGREYKCIPEVECESPCLEINGKLYVEGERISDPTVVDQCQSCHCLRGKINCTGERCTIPSEETYVTPEVTVGCSETGWTPWMNTGHSLEGDNELLDNSQLKQIYNYYCDIYNITDIECRVARSKVPYKETGQIVYCSLPQGLQCINEKQTSGRCEDYEIRLFCSCVSTVTTTLYSTPAVTPCSPTWTNYFNIDNPTNDKIVGGDFEILQKIEKNHEICSNSDIIDIECKASYNGKLIDYKETGQKDLTCTKDKGFICINRMQENGMCQDYKVRFLCSCVQTQCTPGWTDFYNTDSPYSGDGDEESLKSLSLRYQFCSVDEVTDIECVTDQNQAKSKKGKSITIDYTETKDKAVICDVRQGLLCLNSNQGKGHRCSDYRVRLFCQCGTTTTVQPPTTLVKKPKVTPTTPKITTEAICPDGQAYFECAYYCNQMCSSFPVLFNLTCDNEDNCIEGCRPIEDCKPPNLWRDYSTCVKKEECTCILNGTLIPPGKVVSIGCEKCQCIENSLLCHTFKDCLSTIPYGARISTTTLLVETTISENCWTKWINIDSPLSGAGDFEHFNKIQLTNGLCPYPVEIECRVASSKLKASDAGQIVECDLKTGLQCWNRYNGEEGCYDYEIRYFCPCETTVTSTVTLPTTLPPIFPTGPCEDGWTQWYNSHRVDDQGDYENVQSARADGKIFCSTDMISAIECRSTTTKSEALQHGVLCNLENGLLCRNADNGFYDQCDDYEVRFYCDCVPPTEITIKSTVAPTVTLPPITLPPTFPTGPCEDGWTQWYNSHRVDDQGDYENVLSVRARGKIFCSTDMISAIECRSTSTKSEALQHGVLCDVENGLLCRNAENGFYDHCDDYEIRFYCDCLPPTEISTKSTAAPTVTLLPKTLPPTFPTGPCEDGWTQWYNSHRVDNQGDYENILSVRARGKIFCSTDMISAIECRSTSTKSEALQHGVLCDLENGLLCRNADNSFYDLCDDYEVRFYCDCVPPTEITTETTVAPTVTIPPSTLPPTFPTGPCEDGWTPWYNSHRVDDQGDYENILSARAHGKIFCSTDMISAIECRSTSTKSDALQHGVLCDLENGLLCRNADNSFYDQCDDYEVRFYCDCVPPTEITTESTVAPTVTLPPITLPPTFPTGPCEDGWTQWYNSHRVDDQGDYENVHSARTLGKIFCSTDMISAIECRSTSTKSEALQQGVLCDLENGLICRNVNNSFYEQCDDYEVRFYCDCLAPTEMTTKTTAAPTITLPPTTQLRIILTGPCEDGWTQWYNSHRVDDQGDYENVLSARAHGKIFCSTDMITAIECRSITTKSEALQHGVLCDLENGLICRNADNSFYEQCDDYEVRFYCDCLPPTEITTKTTAAPTVSLPATTPSATTPPILPTGPCEDGWTQWYNSHTVNNEGDFETVLSVRTQGKVFCSSDMITALECRSGTTKSQTLQHGVSCNLENGLLCRNADLSHYEECDDYEVRFYCDCIQPTEVTTTETPSVTTACNVWSRWINDNHPVSESTKKAIKGGKTGDTERKILYRLQVEENFCMQGELTKIDCQDAETDVTYTETGDVKLLCSVKRGFRCRGKDQPSGVCKDYKIRYFCSCETYSLLTEITEENTTPTEIWKEKTVPPTEETCVGYSRWIDMPFSETGIDESIESIIFKAKICSKPIRIECRNEQKNLDYSKIRQNMFCDLEHGLQCKHEDQSDGFCHIYQVRIACWVCEPTITPTSPVLLCPETPESMRENCVPGCPSGLVCDGTMCVEHADCPCFKQNKKFKPGNIHVTSDCQVCECLLEGYSTCKPITCNLECDEGQKPKLTDDCDCKCEGCPSGTRICNTNGECIKEELWCDGTVDCPDDETNCTTTKQILTTVTEAIYPTEMICSTDFESETASCDMMINYFDTFDGLEYQYEICDHILLEEIGNGKFSVTVHKACSPEDSNKCWKYVMIYVDDITVKLGPGNEDLEFNGQKISIENIQLLSNRHPGIILRQYGNWLVFQSLNYNFDVIWDSRQNVKIVVSKCLINQVNGLCGFYNNYIFDDRQQPNGTLVHSNKDFGDSWSIGPLERCSLPSCADEIMVDALKICQQLENPPFVNCSSVLSISNQIEVCVAFMCECLKDPESEKYESCKCQALGDFMETCEFENNVLMPDWRIEHDCASPVCPPDMEWNECGAGCRLTCDNYRERETICTNDCVPGCYCSSGLVQHHGHCIKPKMCHDCVCDGYGDPNYYTFDSRSYAFQGNCTYVLAQHQSHDDILSFRVLSTNVECVEEPHTTCTYGLRVEWKGHFAEIRNNNKEVYFDGILLKATDYPFESEGFNIVSTLGEKTEIYVKEINLAVLYSDHLYSYSIRLPSFLYFNQTEGLCGICNFDGSDDFYHKDGYITDDINDFAYSWLVDNSRDKCTLPPIHPTTPPPGICNFTDNACEMIIDSTWYSQACLNDVTYSKNPKASVCRSKIQYAKKCCERGISLRNWLLESECDLTCPGNMIFECASQCQKTCDNYRVYDENNCDREYTCTCPLNKVLKEGQCVDSILCETCEDGHVVGDQWDEDLCHTCECTNELTINCIKNPCPEPPICGVDEKLEVIPPHPNACCNLYSCVPSVTTAPKRLCLYQHHYDVVNGSNLQLSQEQYYVEAYELGSSWEDGLCTKCSCKETDGQIAQNCEIEQCPTVTDMSNTNGYVQENIPGVCCPKYHRVHCVSDGKLYMINEEWPSPEGNKCTTFKCIKGPNGDAIVSEKKTLCDTTCPRYAVYEEPEPESPHCCGHCKTTVCVEDGTIHQEGDTWQPASEPCFTANCLIAGNMAYITYRENSCPAIPDNCPNEHIILDPKGCCKICRITPGMCAPLKVPENNTVHYFKLEDLERGECKNNEPISDLMRCSGRCESTAYFYSHRNSFENHCKCCEARASEEREVTLDCIDGTKIVKTYQQPTDCVCSACATDVIGTAKIQ